MRESRSLKSVFARALRFGERVVSVARARQKKTRFTKMDQHPKYDRSPEEIKRDQPTTLLTRFFSSIKTRT
jgi:hypothetical protein